MTERVKQILDLLPEHIRSLPPARLFGLLGVLGAFIAVGLVSLLWMSDGGRQQVLYTQLTIEDAAAITAKLGEMQIPYTLAGDGTTILSPSHLVYDTRLRLASEGLPQGGGSGFELFDQTNFGMTEFMQKLNYQRALQGELARTIARLAAVLNARVHIALPEKSLFIEQQDEPTASVVLKLTSGRRLTPEQVTGITHLVSSSIVGLSPDNVTIVDTTGRILNHQQQNSSLLSQTEAQLDYQQTLQQNIERRVQSLLEPTVGKGKVLVRATATLDLQHSERTEELFDAENPAIRSEQRSSEQGGGSGFTAAGVPGVRTNVSTTGGNTQTNTGSTSSSRESETINYEVSKKVSKIVTPSGGIKQLSVAVLVDGTYKPGGRDGENVYVPRTEAELSQYREIVKSAVGYNESRGDRIEVANMPFQPQEELAELSMDKAEQWAFWLSLSRYGAYIVVGLLLTLFVGRPLVKWITNGSRTMPVEARLPRTVQELEADMGAPELLPGMQEEEKDTSPPFVLKPFVVESTLPAMRTQMTEFFRSEPERAVEIVRAWLRD